MSDAIHDADECAQAIEKALETMNPPIEIHVTILKLIGEMAFGDDEWRYFDSEHFKVDGRTITRTSKYGAWRSAYGAETVSSGQRSWRIRIEKRTSSSLMFIGVSRNRDRTNTSFYGGDSGYAYNAALGVVWDGYHKAICFSVVKASDGDVISVKLDADARTLTFRKKGRWWGWNKIGTVDNIKRGEYCIAVSMRTGDSVSFA